MVLNRIEMHARRSPVARSAVEEHGGANVDERIRGRTFWRSEMRGEEFTDDELPPLDSPVLASA
jgi:hypothetical protein